MPFITEELWQRVAPLAAVEGKTIMLQPWPRPHDDATHQEAIEDIRWLKELVLGVRRIRAEYDIEPRRPLPLLLQGGDGRDRQRQARLERFLSSLTRAESIDWLDDDIQAPESATALIGELKLLIPLAGLIDKAAELKRLGRDMDKLRADLERSTAKLNNPNFVERAPGDVVEKERRRVEDMTSALAKLEQQAARISAL
jgi:valyl-tRNA synthetase